MLIQSLCQRRSMQSLWSEEAEDSSFYQACLMSDGWIPRSTEHKSATSSSDARMLVQLAHGQCKKRGLLLPDGRGPAYTSNSI